MNAMRNECLNALSNLSKTIDAGRRFPRNVFLGPWSDFLFFDSDWLFDARFVEQVKSLLDIEGGTCACLANLDQITDGDQDRHLLFIDGSTTQNAYRLLLKGETSGSGWIHDMDRFACVSDVSQWCIYCERASEIAVIGFQTDISVERYMLVVAQLKAARIAEAAWHDLFYGFSAQALSAQWRSELLQEYAQAQSGNRSPA